MRIAFIVTALTAFLVGGPADASASQDQQKQYVGSDTCQACHPATHERWQRTLMARILQDPQVTPGVILGDFSTPHPLVTFDEDDIAFTYGSKWKQRYFARNGDDYYVLPAQWDVRNRVWRSYYVRDGTEWWVPFYPAEQEERPTGTLCDGCHSTNYDIRTKTVTEWNVGCERCHGPGSLHVQSSEAADIVNPARLDDVRANDVCIQCHSQGQPRENPIEGRYYDWAVGYEPGERLSDVWTLEQPHLGQETFTHWPEGSAHKNRMQGNDFVSSLMYRRGVRCSSCHDVHGTEHGADLIRPGNAVCTQCHQPTSPVGPTGTVEMHTQHAAGSTGSQCVACHMPSIARTVGDVTVRSHTFKFITPGMTESYGVPNPCTSCHTDQTLDWARDELRAWPHVSPWRVAQ